MADHRLPAFRRIHPGPVDPGRIVAHVLVVAASEFGDPVACFVLMETGDRLIQALNVEPTGAQTMSRV